MKRTSSSRRRFLSAQLLGGILAIPLPSICASKPLRVTQDELDDALRAHTLWLSDPRKGKRATFAGRDLSGLIFRSGTTRIDLTSADFAESNLRETSGGELLFKGSSLQGANFTGSIYRSPIFCYANLARAACDKVDWGRYTTIEIDRSLNLMMEGPSAQFSHCYVGYASFVNATMCAYITASSFHDSAMRRADLSHSTISGERSMWVSLAGCDLRGANFNNTKIGGTSFNYSQLENISFMNAIIGNDVRGLDLHP